MDSSNVFTPYGHPRYAHQQQGLRRLIMQRGVGALLFDPGLGKTATVLDYISILARKLPSQHAKVLVVAPLVAVDTWVDQMPEYISPDISIWGEALGGTGLQKCEALASRGGSPFKRPLCHRKGKKLGPRLEKEWYGCQPSAQHTRRAVRLLTSEGVDQSQGPVQMKGPAITLVSVNIELISQRGRVGSKTMADIILEAVQRFAPDLVVVDESHLIKGNGSHSSRLMARISKHVPRRVLLTGTVMPQGPLDVFGQWRFLDPLAFGRTLNDGRRVPLNFHDFKSRYSVSGGFKGKEVVSYRNIDELQAVMGKLSVVAKKEDCLDLPATQDVILTVTPNEKEVAAYEECCRKLVVNMDDGTKTAAANRVTQFIRLRQIACGHMPNGRGEIVTLGTSKVDKVTSLVDTTLAGQNRIVVFCAFSHEVRSYTEALSKGKNVVLRVDGGTPQDERIKIRKRFASNSTQRLIIVAQIETMSTSINELVIANTAIFTSLPMRRDVFIQARDRLNRSGQKRKVTYYHLQSADTVDQKIYESHLQRTDLESSVLSHVLRVSQKDRTAP